MSTAPLAPAIQQRLKQALTSGLRLGATEIRFINVEIYQARLGPLWSKYKPIIHSYVQSAASKYLAEADFLISSQNGYVIIFADPEKERVERISKSMAEYIDERLRENEHFQSPPLVSNIVAIDTATLYDRIQGAQQPHSSAGSHSAAPEANAAAPVSEAHKEQIARYAPLWHPKSQSIVGSLSVPTPVQGTRRSPDRQYYEPSETRALSDIRMFSALLTDAYTLQKQGQNAIAIFSIHFKCFCLPAMHKEYIHALRQTPASLVKYLMPRFVRIPPGTPRTLIADRLASIAPIFKSVVLHTKPVADLKTLEFLPFAVLSTSWSEIELLAGQEIDASQRQNAAERIAKSFCQSARVMRAKCMIDGINSLHALEMVSAAGIDFASGPAIGSFETTLQGPRPLEISALQSTSRVA
ncbi:MAG: hypothetical protein ABL973_15485 [Micropepsaceae bacterium]